ncbi:unnamed protein product [Parnassius mnemosyne]|uniref:Uncharacterized protein n=1 Tax=Parnassius mnemosyne TaxID=213953 RepID=A0AAV1LEE2_9NEOP
MLRVLLCVCTVPAVVSIIVTDYPPTSTEYNYSYNVIDLATGDAKTLHEIRQGDTVSGSYSLIDPDGTRRTVKYTAGPKTGFKAVIHKEPVAMPQIVKHKVHKITNHHAPIFIERLAPIPYCQNKNKLRQSTYSPSANKYSRLYFTPDSKIEPDKPDFNKGEYFIPNKTY